MKVLCLFVAALCFVSASAQISAESKRIMQEFKKTVAEFDAQISVSTNNIYATVELRAQAYFKAYVNQRNEIDSLLPSLSVRGQAIARAMLAEIDTHIAVLKKAFDDKTMRTIIITKTTEVRNRFVGALEFEIQRLQYFVDINPKHAKCWDGNKGQLKAIIDKALSQTKTVVQVNLNAFDLKIKDITGKIDAAVNRIKSDLAPFNGDKVKINNYFELRITKLTTEFKSYRRIAISAVKDSIKRIYQGLDLIYKKSAIEYKDLRRKVVACIRQP